MEERCDHGAAIVSGSQPKINRLSAGRGIGEGQANVTPGPVRANDQLDDLRTENRRVRAQVHHLTVELRDARERIAFPAQELDGVRGRHRGRGRRNRPDPGGVSLTSRHDEPTLTAVFTPAPLVGVKRDALTPVTTACSRERSLRRPGMKRGLGLLLVLVLSTACARSMWVKSGATPDEFRRDAYECERDARPSDPLGGGIAGAMNFRDFATRCMNARGYRQVPANSTAVNAWK